MVLSLPPAPPAAADPAALARELLDTGLLSPGEGVLVALSGGADSVALAGLLAAAAAHGLPLRLVLAHLDHGWRGAQEAAADLRMARSVAERLALPLRTAGPPAPPTPGEEAARRWRYATLARLAREEGLASVATGHHLRDQAETFLVRLLRGSRAHGLAGIPRRRALDAGHLCVVRPLLNLHPSALRAFNRAQGLAWREDATNTLPGERNDARRRLDALESQHPGSLATMGRLVQRLRDRLTRREAALNADLGSHLDVALPGAAVSLPRSLLLPLRGETLALALRLLGAALGAEAQGPWFTQRHVDLWAAALRGLGALDLPQGLSLRVGETRAWLVRRRPFEPGSPGEPSLLLHETLTGVASPSPRSARGDPVAEVDAALLGSAPVLRPLRPDDQFVPGGGPGGRLIPAGAWLGKRGVPRAARSQAWVVVGDTGVAWLVGCRVDTRHVVGPSSERSAHLRVVGLSPAPDRTAGAAPREQEAQADGG